MRRGELTEAQQRYRAYDRRCQIAVKVMGALFAVLLIWFAVELQFADEKPYRFLIPAGILVLLFAVAGSVSIYLGRKHAELYAAAYGNDTELIPTGLFGDLWQEFEDHRFEDLTDGKVVFAEADSGAIELQIVRKRHEFDIEIDQDAIYMVMDEETDAPVEKEVPLAEIADIGQAFAVIRDFVERV